MGYKSSDTEKYGATECEPYDSFAVVSQLSVARGFDLSPNSGNAVESMVPVTGDGHNILHVDFVYDDPTGDNGKDKWVYWVDFGTGDSAQNGIYRVRLNGTEKQHVIKVLPMIHLLSPLYI